MGDLQGWLVQLGGSRQPEDGATVIDQITLLERIKAAACAARARLTVEFKTSRVAERKAAGVRSRDLTKGIGAEVALARRESPSRAGRLVGMAEALVHEMPHTMAALTAGEVSE